MSGGDRTEIRLAGAGGQGVVTAGRILAEAAILSGRTSTHSQVFGPQSRGGASRSDVVIADAEIGFPLALDLDVLVVLSEAAYTRYVPELGDAATLVVDERAVPGTGDGRPQTHRFPIVETAHRIVGSPVATGVVALGVLEALTGLVDAAALEKAVGSRVPAHRREANIQALAAGRDLGQAA